MPIYRAKITIGEQTQMRLVDAPNEARALKHIARQHISVEVVRTAAQITETAALAARGIKVEVADATE